MYDDDVIIYAIKCRLKVCINNISNWYSMNKLCIDKKKSNVMDGYWKQMAIEIIEFI